MSLFAVDAEDRVTQLISLTEQLTARLVQETQAYEAHRPHEAAAGVAETARLANLYRHEAMRVKLQPQTISGSKPESRARLTRVTQAFEKILARHGAAVNAARMVSEGLVRAIAEEVTKNRSRATGYGPAARMAATNASAIALNQRA